MQGAQRIEPATVLSYLSIHEGDPYNKQVVDRSLKALFGTGLFADVKINWDGAKLTNDIVENPIINQIVFEGEDKVSEKDLTKESVEATNGLHPLQGSVRRPAHHRTLPSQRQIRRDRRSADHSAAAEPRRPDFFDQ